MYVISNVKRLPWQDVNEVEAARVADLLGLETHKGTRKEARKYVCPLHGGLSLHAYYGPGGGFYCWGACGRAYSNVDLAAEVWHVEPSEACERLAGLLGLRLPERGPRRTRQKPRRQPRRPRPAPTPRRAAKARQNDAQASVSEPGLLQELRELGYVPSGASEVYGSLLAELELTDRGAEYLQGRGFDPDAAEEYGFRSLDGPDGWRRLRETLAESYLPEELERAGLHRWPARIDRSPALVIPYVHQGEAIALRFRRLEAGEPKLVNLAGVPAPALPFNAAALDGLEGEELHVAEGELNAYSLAECGLRAIGLPGAGSWRSEWTPRVVRADRVVAWYDSDEAGERGETKLADALQVALGSRWLEERGRAVELGPGQDANDLHREGRLRELAERAPWRLPHGANVTSWSTRDPMQRTRPHATNVP